MRNVAIVGSGQTQHGRRDDVSFSELIFEAVQKALEDANIDIGQVDAIVQGSMPPQMEGINSNHLFFSDSMGGYSLPVLRTATCGSTGMSVAQAAYYHVSSGMFDVVLAVGAEKMYESDPQGTMSTVADPFFQRPFLAGAPGIFSLQSKEYLHRFGIEEERLREAAAVLSVKNHKDAFDNPYAHIKIDVSVEDVKKSRIIAYPVRLLDVCPASDGACAIILASEEMAQKLSRKPAWIKGVGYCGDEHFYGDSDKVQWKAAIQAAQKAYKMAGIQNPRQEIDVLEIYNPFTFQELLFYECFGFSDFGQACSLVESGAVMRDGDIPCTPSGGVLCTNPIGASGLIRVAEAAMQVVGKAGAHQIPGAKTAFASAMGGMCQLVGAMVIGVEK